ncbi:hypothetical protein HELRODRAFT_161995 [Helobdella robusta]|uniref:Uncharacterized protein n=1 Tax=Helobdella robusta TaxID=6412 RepID=T1ES48_HELRO|nr:hypothetical protein HELRODRAFT_161995 [Helobdella robusta]ESO02701.1 hypothetical protein HELRODRAFT_161995 [Helobdella robusta]
MKNRVIRNFLTQIIIIMALLLGSRNCIDSLTYDIQDVQTIISEIVSKIGTLNYTSWKFPDKLACSVNIEELVKHYSFSKNQEDNQTSHIMLFELLIDRLFLVLCTFLDSIQKHLKKSSTTTPNSANNIKSIGLVVKKCWNGLTKLFLLAQDHSAKNTSNDIRQIFPNPFNNVQKETTNQASQTTETTFAIACSSCKVFQLALSSLSSLIKETNNNVNRTNAIDTHSIWISEKDIDSSIEKHRDILKNIQQSFQNLMNDKQKLTNAAKLHENNLQNKENLINKLKKQLDINGETFNEKIKSLESDKKKLETEKSDQMLAKEKELKGLLDRWKREIEELKKELTLKESFIHKLGSEVNGLQKELKENEARKMKLSEEFQTNLKKLNEHLAAATADLKKADEEIAKERLKHQLFNDGLSNLQQKYDKLIQRLDEFNTKNEDLVVRLKRSEEKNVQNNEILSALRAKLVEKEKYLQNLSLNGANIGSGRSPRSEFLSPRQNLSHKEEFKKRKSSSNVLKKFSKDNKPRNMNI